MRIVRPIRRLKPAVVVSWARVGVPWAPMPTLRELAAAAGLAGVVAAGTLGIAAVQQDARPVGVPTLVCIAVAAAVWAWHRVAPAATALLVVATVAGYIIAGQPYGPIQLLVALGCYAVARHRPALVSAATCAAAAAAIAAALWTRLTGEHLFATIAILLAWPLVFVVVPALVGALVRVRSEAAARERDELLARGAYEERLRVAREVHDIAGHGFAVVAMQAGVALTVLDEQPGQVKISLEAIRTSSEQALRELHGSLHQLRTEPGARDIPSLVRQVRATGLTVDLDVTPSGGALASAVSTTMYRVVQEALTNVVRHAGPTSATVTITHRDNQVEVAVRDRGTGSSHEHQHSGRQHDRHRGGGQRGGHGLAGLRERVEGAGGNLTAGPRESGGFEVIAQLPYDARDDQCGDRRRR